MFCQGDIHAALRANTLQLHNHGVTHYLPKCVNIPTICTYIVISTGFRCPIFTILCAYTQKYCDTTVVDLVHLKEFPWSYSEQTVSYVTGPTQLSLPYMHTINFYQLSWGAYFYMMRPFQLS